mmetsp:Transcript_11445/g.18081  ORF Transcript_11445/g.18081 Transcript_11445/m.18081 type:complete len:219 (-) Transcript_11445:957-1613(-)
MRRFEKSSVSRSYSMQPKDTTTARRVKNAARLIQSTIWNLMSCSEVILELVPAVAPSEVDELAKMRLSSPASPRISAGQKVFKPEVPASKFIRKVLHVCAGSIPLSTYKEGRNSESLSSDKCFSRPEMASLSIITGEPMRISSPTWEVWASSSRRWMRSGKALSNRFSVALYCLDSYPYLSPMSTGLRKERLMMSGVLSDIREVNLVLVPSFLIRVFA